MQFDPSDDVRGTLLFAGTGDKKYVYVNLIVFNGCDQPSQIVVKENNGIYSRTGPGRRSSAARVYDGRRTGAVISPGGWTFPADRDMVAGPWSSPSSSPASTRRPTSPS
jgi:hypothetical protein